MKKIVVILLLFIICIAEHAYALSLSNYIVMGTLASMSDENTLGTEGEEKIPTSPSVVIKDVVSSIDNGAEITIQYSEVGEPDDLWHHEIYMSALYDNTSQNPEPTENWSAGNVNGSALTLSCRPALITDGTKHYVYVAVVSYNDRNGKRTYFANGVSCSSAQDLNAAIHEAQNSPYRITIAPRLEHTQVTIQVREGDSYIIDAPKIAHFDDANGRTILKYSYNDQEPIVNSSCVMPSMNGNYSPSKGKWVKSKTDNPVNCQVHVLSMNGEEIDTYKYTALVRVYNRPAPPSEILRKGNGTSNSFIAIMPVSDNELSAQGYHFAFCSDAGLIKDCTERIAVLPGRTLDDIKIATYWTFDDQSVVYSDFHDGSHCTWSTFDGSGPHSRVTVDEMAEGIDHVAVDALQTGLIYDMQGRRVMDPQRGVLYLIKGKKVIFK